MSAPMRFTDETMTYVEVSPGKFVPMDPANRDFRQTLEGREHEIAEAELAPQVARQRAPAEVAQTAGGREILVGGKAFQLDSQDLFSLLGALALAVDGETARLTLASGETLELTHQDVSDIGRQLAGKPADAVSGQDRTA